MIRAGGLILLVASTLLPARAADRLLIGYVDIRGDPWHDDRMGFGSIPLEIRGRPYDGVVLALDDATVAGRAAGFEFELTAAEAATPEGLIGEVRNLHARGARLIFADAPAATLAAVAKASAGSELLLFNVAAEDDKLRAGDCAENLMHLYPSMAMRTDALTQYIVARKWRDVLVLEGQSLEDAEFAAAFERSARRFGAKIVDKRRFVLGSDPRAREANNPALLTGGVSYDVVFVADASGELARFLPYQTLLPRPVIGSVGLTPEAWHWAWDRDGGPSLSRRFRRRAGRPMRGADWAAWVGVKAVVEAVLRTKSTDLVRLAAQLHSRDFRFDGSKGQALSFRSWDNQLRQPVQLATWDAVIAQAPLSQFLHPEENLDTLGYDRPESTCEVAK
jgi:ABC transporter substrate binding protein (PQQ-dependent alcohol dehydrogenase system)